MVRRARKAAHSTEGARVSADVSVDVVSGVSSSADEVVAVSSESDVFVSPTVAAGDGVPEDIVMDSAPAVVPDIPAVVPDIPAVVPDIPAVVPDIPAVVPDIPAVSPVVGGESMADVMSDDTSFASDVVPDDSVMDMPGVSVSDDDIMASFPDPVAAGVVDVSPASVPASASSDSFGGGCVSDIVAVRSGSHAPGERVSMSQLIAERSGSFVRGSEVAKMSASDIIKSRTFTGGGQRPSAVIRSRMNAKFSELDGKCHTKVIG